MRRANQFLWAMGAVGLLLTAGPRVAGAGNVVHMAPAQAVASVPQVTQVRYPYRAYRPYTPYSRFSYGYGPAYGSYYQPSVQPYVYPYYSARPYYGSGAYYGGYYGYGRPRVGYRGW